MAMSPQVCKSISRSHLRLVTHAYVENRHTVQYPKFVKGKRWIDFLGVFVDLAGPQAITSHSGFCYIMNIIDDFSGYHWTHLLKSKSEVACVMQEWLLAAENQTKSSVTLLPTTENFCQTRHFTGVPNTALLTSLLLHTLPHTMAMLKDCTKH